MIKPTICVRKNTELPSSTNEVRISSESIVMIKNNIFMDVQAAHFTTWWQCCHYFTHKRRAEAAVKQLQKYFVRYRNLMKQMCCTYRPHCPQIYKNPIGPIHHLFSLKKRRCHRSISFTAITNIQPPHAVTITNNICMEDRRFFFMP